MAEGDMPSSLQFDRQESIELTKSWTKIGNDRSMILPEYLKAYDMCCISRRLMTRAPMREIFAYLDKVDIHTGKLGFEVALRACIARAYDGKENSKCVVTGGNIVESTLLIYDTYTWRQRYFHAAIRVFAQQLDPGSLILLLAEFCRTGTLCLAAKRFAFTTTMELVDYSSEWIPLPMDTSKMIKLNEESSLNMEDVLSNRFAGLKFGSEMSLSEVSVSERTQSEYGGGNSAHSLADHIEEFLEEKSETPALEPDIEYDLPFKREYATFSSVESNSTVENEKEQQFEELHAKPVLGLQTSSRSKRSRSYDSTASDLEPTIDQACFFGMEKFADAVNASTRAKEFIDDFAGSYVAEYISKAFRNAFMEPLWTYYTNIDEIVFAEVAEQHAVNTFTGIINATLGIPIPIPCFDDFAGYGGCVPFLRIQQESFKEAIKALALPKNFGKNFLSIPACKFPRITSVIPNQEFIFGGNMNSKALTFRAIDPSDQLKPQREELAEYLENFMQWFRDEVFVEMFIGQLTQDRADAMNVVFLEMKDSEYIVSDESDYRYYVWDLLDGRFHLDRAKYLLMYLDIIV